LFGLVILPWVVQGDIWLLHQYIVGLSRCAFCSLPRNEMLRTCHVKPL